MLLLSLIFITCTLRVFLHSKTCTDKIDPGTYLLYNTSTHTLVHQSGRISHTPDLGKQQIELTGIGSIVQHIHINITGTYGVNTGVRGIRDSGAGRHQPSASSQDLSGRPKAGLHTRGVNSRRHKKEIRIKPGSQKKRGRCVHAAAESGVTERCKNKINGRRNRSSNTEIKTTEKQEKREHDTLERTSAKPAQKQPVGGAPPGIDNTPAKQEKAFVDRRSTQEKKVCPPENSGQGVKRVHDTESAESHIKVAGGTHRTQTAPAETKNKIYTEWLPENSGAVARSTHPPRNIHNLRSAGLQIEDEGRNIHHRHLRRNTPPTETHKPLRRNTAYTQQRTLHQSIGEESEAKKKNCGVAAGTRSRESAREEGEETENEKPGRAREVGEETENKKPGSAREVGEETENANEKPSLRSLGSRT